MNWWWIGGAVLVGALYIFAPLVICTLRQLRLRSTSRHDNADGIPPALQQIISRFEWRASSRQCGSHAILALILGLLAAAAWVFIQAKEITARETGGDLSQKLVQTTAKQHADVIEQTRLRDALTTAVAPVVNMIGTNSSGPTSGVLPLPAPIELLDSRYVIKPSDSIAQEITKQVKDMYPGNSSPPPVLVALTVSGQRIDVTSGLSVTLQILGFLRLVTPSDVEKLANSKNLWETKDLSGLVSQFDQISHTVEIGGGVLSRIALEEHNYEVAKAAGEETQPETPGNLSTPFLLQLNITRFGTITLASIAIGILVPLYRFSERLSAFYRARADALRLHQAPGYKGVGIIRLSTMLTPNIDYGKSQNMPDHLIDVLGRVANYDK